MADRVIPDRVVAFARGGGRELRRALATEERSALQARQDALRRALAAWRGEDRPALADAIDGMLGAFGANRRVDFKTAAAMTAGYLEAVAGLPPWAVIAAAMDVRRGTAGLNPGYCPNEPEFVQLVRDRLAPYQRALANVAAILAASSALPEREDRRCRPSYEELRARYDGPNGEPWGIAPIEDDARKQAAHAAAIAANDAAIRREWEALGLEPIMSAGWPISVSLARALGVTRRKEAPGV